MISKNDLVDGTYKLIRISGLTSNAIPEEIETAIQVADDYAGELLSMGLDIGWIQPATYGQSDPSDYSGLGPQTIGPLKKLLAIELVDYFGKPVPMSLQSKADKAMRSLEQLFVNVLPMQNPATLPIGSGNEQDYRSTKFYPEPISDDGAIYQNKSDVFELPIDWSGWLAGFYLLDTVTYEVTTGIVLTGSTIVDDISLVTVSFDRVGQFTLCAKATNSNGDVRTQKVIYNVTECKDNYYP